MKVKNIMNFFIAFTFISVFAFGDSISEDDLIILDKKREPAKLDIEVRKINSTPLKMRRNRSTNKVSAEILNANNNLIFAAESLNSLPISDNPKGKNLLKNLTNRNSIPEIKSQNLSLEVSNLENGNKKIEVTPDDSLDSLYVYVVDEKDYSVQKVYRGEFIDYIEPIADYSGEFTLNPKYTGYNFESENWFFPVKPTTSRPWLDIKDEARYGQNTNTTQLKYVSSGTVIASNISYNSTTIYPITVGTSTISMKFANDNPAGNANYNKPTYRLSKANYSGYAGTTQIVYVAANGNSYYQTIHILGDPLNLTPTIDANGLNFGDILKYSDAQTKDATTTIKISGATGSISSRVKMRIKGALTSTEIQKSDSIGSTDSTTKMTVSNLKLTKIGTTTDFNLTGTLNFKGTEQAGSYVGSIVVEAYVE